MSNWKQRVLEENKDLQNKIFSLKAWLEQNSHSDADSEFDNIHTSLLEIQLKQMQAYHTTLAARIHLFDKIGD